MQKISKNIKETEDFAKNFLNKLKSYKNKATVVGLYGDLGAGKTTFTQQIAKILGVKKRVNSPTFVIMKNYDLKNKDFEKMFHLDAYRLKNEKELFVLGWEEMIKNPKHLIFIEWPEQIIKAMPQKHHKILISHTKEGHRKFNFKKA